MVLSIISNRLRRRLIDDPHHPFGIQGAVLFKGRRATWPFLLSLNSGMIWTKLQPGECL